MPWNPSEIPDQSGRVAVITGANSGIGFKAARHLAAKGATVIMACRNLEKARAARARLPADANVRIVELDLGSQASVKKAAEEILAEYPRLDLLLNNAGIMWLEEGRTEDGFERQFGINHLGHFTLTALLLPALRDVVGSRIVTVSSIAHRAGRIHFDNIHLDGQYGRQRAYAQAKLANLMFAVELDRRLQRAGAQTRSLACHPGIASTNLAGPGIAEETPLGIGRVVRWLWPLMTQSAEKAPGRHSMPPPPHRRRAATTTAPPALKKPSARHGKHARAATPWIRKKDSVSGRYRRASPGNIFRELTGRPQGLH
jgi:NAD(P)-dependent dehydrogenase (short-subunit alcohol dehydrogenase family)